MSDVKERLDGGDRERELRDGRSEGKNQGIRGSTSVLSEGLAKAEDREPFGGQPERRLGKEIRNTGD